MIRKKCGYVSGALCRSESCRLLELGEPTGEKQDWFYLQQLALRCPWVAWPRENQIRISDIREFKACRARWHFTSPLSMFLKPAAPDKHLWLGRGLHWALGKYYSSGMQKELLLESFETWLAEQWELLGENVDELEEVADLGRTMLKHYLMWAPARDDFEVASVETELKVPLPIGERTFFVGRADTVIKLKNGEYWLLEHKSMTHWPEFSLLLTDDQAASYVWGMCHDLRFRGICPSGVIFNFLRKKAPVIPRVLQNGEMSKANIDTSKEVYLAALRKQGLDPSGYLELINKLEKDKPFFVRVPVRISEKRLEVFERDLISVAKDMLSNPAIYPSQSYWAWYQCARCPFKVPCQFMQSGADYNELLESDYVKREDMYEEEKYL